MLYISIYFSNTYTLWEVPLKYLHPCTETQLGFFGTGARTMCGSGDHYHNIKNTLQRRNHEFVYCILYMYHFPI